MATIRLAIASDLHYTQANPPHSPLPATASTTEAFDPMRGLLALIKDETDKREPSRRQLRADLLLCPGDITDQASEAGFEEGWKQLKSLQAALGAEHLLAATGNHEVHSRSDPRDDSAGNSVRAIDPLSMIQKHKDYPCSCFKNDERWVYWGRGYKIVELENLVVLVINTSHFHPTTRANEFERGRISDVALSELKTELNDCVSRLKGSACFVVLMHHHPIPYPATDAPTENIEMHNGAQLMQALEATDVAWIVIHGHKHAARLGNAQGGSNAPIVFAAGSFGARLDGVLATKTGLQFYILELEICNQQVQPTIRGQLRAWYWAAREWVKASKQTDGLPDRCGFQRPAPSGFLPIAADLAKHLQHVPGGFLKWEEAVDQLSDLAYLPPDKGTALRNAMQACGVSCTWEDQSWFPLEVGLK